MTTAPAPQPPIPQPPINEAYATFASNIDQAAVQRIFSSVATGTLNKVTHIHLLFQSIGGYVCDGVCLYNFFQKLPIGLTLYNVGSVQSIATIAYLGAQRRITAKTATFMIHRSSNIPITGTAASHQAAASMLTIDDKRTEDILRSHLKLTPEQWTEIDRHGLVISGEEAVKAGLADALGEFAPPKGIQIYNL